jgi:5-methylcytosine-specific restriction endonuclease McrA
MAYSNEIKLQVQVAIGCGMTVQEVVEAFGISKTTINCWLNLGRLKRQRQAVREWRKENLEKAKEAHLRWRRENPQKAREFARQYAENWRIKNPEKAKIKNRKNYEDQYAKKPEYFAEKARRRRLKSQDFPMCEIEKMMCRNYYLMARELTERTGIKHEVDHIWPISKGGPHLPWNLQVLTAEENRRKRDKI